MINFILGIFLHLDTFLYSLLTQYNTAAYIVVFVIIFIETGLVITPFLPGDSLIFAVGAIAAAGGPVSKPLVLLLLCAAAVAGDTVNFHIGCAMREKVLRREKIPLVKQEHIDKTQAFFARNGGKTITIARFIPIIRTFAPFVAGVGEMKYRRFLMFNVAGGVSWVALMFSIGFFFGNISAVKSHFSLIVVAIIIISVIPAVAALIKSRFSAAQA